MKVIDLKEAKERLEFYAEECRETPIVVTIDGRRAFELTPLETDDDDNLINNLIEHNAEFQEFLRQRMIENDREGTISMEEVRRRLLGEKTTPAKESP